MTNFIPAYRCCYCNYFNPARKTRQNAPSLEEEAKTLQRLSSKSTTDVSSDEGNSLDDASLKGNSLEDASLKENSLDDASLKANSLDGGNLTKDNSEESIENDVDDDKSLEMLGKSQFICTCVLGSVSKQVL